MFHLTIRKIALAIEYVLDQKKMDSMTKLFISFGLVMKPAIAVMDKLAIEQK